MPLNNSTINGITTIGTHAPSVNFVVAMMIATIAVATEPTPLIAMLRR